MQNKTHYRQVDGIVLELGEQSGSVQDGEQLLDQLLVVLENDKNI
jgi:hypothetical protein